MRALLAGRADASTPARMCTDCRNARHRDASEPSAADLLLAVCLPLDAAVGAIAEDTRPGTRLALDGGLEAAGAALEVAPEAAGRLRHACSLMLRCSEFLLNSVRVREGILKGCPGLQRCDWMK
jgi:hypothetical protein